MREEDHEYRYLLKPLIIPGMLFLGGYPVLTVLLVLIFKVSLLEQYILAGIYGATLLGLVVLWIFGKSKRIRIMEDKLVMISIAGERKIEPTAIRRVALYTLPKGEEIVQIKTRKQVYYVSELYFPFSELMVDLEHFVKKHKIRSNIA